MAQIVIDFNPETQQVKIVTDEAFCEHFKNWDYTLAILGMAVEEAKFERAICQTKHMQQQAAKQMMRQVQEQQIAADLGRKLKLG